MQNRLRRRVYGVHWTTLKGDEGIERSGVIRARNDLVWFERAESLSRLKKVLQGGGTGTGSRGNRVAVIVDLTGLSPRLVGGGGVAYRLPAGGWKGVEFLGTLIQVLAETLARSLNSSEEKLLMALQKVRPNTEILHAAIIDGINLYVREALLAHGLLEQRRLDEWTGPDLDDLKHAIANRIAASWETCEIEQEA